MAYPVLTFATFDALETYINHFWISNNNREITGIVGNNVVNGELSFIRQSPLNWQKVSVIASGGVVVAPTPMNLFMTIAPSSLTWGNNIYNEFVFINSTNSDIYFASGTYYYDVSLTAKSLLPAKTVLRIAKANNGLWIEISSTTSSTTPTGSGNSLRLTVGASDAPIAGASTYQNDKLIGLDDTNNRLSFKLDGQWWDSWGNNAGFTFDSITGILDIAPNTWPPNGAGLEIPLLKSVL